MLPNSAATRSLISRRKLLLLAGHSAGALALAACGNDTGGTVSDNASGSSGCARTPDQPEGPYFTSVELERVDIANGRPGSLLELNFTVVDSGNCLPLGSAEVEIWHADASGVYSGFSNQGIETTGETFLRGSQSTDGNGTVRFTTVYPGWYPGRTTHIHAKVSLFGEERVTTQLYFPDDVSNDVYTSHEAYADRGGKDTTNDTDSAGGNLARLRMDVTAANTGHFGTHIIGIDR